VSTADGTTVSYRGKVRESLFPEQPHLRDGFLVLNSNRAYGRKRLDLTIAGFAQFSRTRPRAYLYLNACGLGTQQREELETARSACVVRPRSVLCRIAAAPRGSPGGRLTQGKLAKMGGISRKSCSTMQVIFARSSLTECHGSSVRLGSEYAGHR
jgi:hypothetical protein